MTEARVPVTDDDLVEKVARAMYEAHVARNKPWEVEGLFQRQRWLSSARAAIAIAYPTGVAAGRDEAAKIADLIADESVLVLDEHDARIRHEGIVAGARASASYIRQMGGE